MASNLTWEATGTSLRLSAELGVGDTPLVGPAPNPTQPSVEGRENLTLSREKGQWSHHWTRVQGNEAGMVALWVRVPSPPGFWERVPNSGKLPRFGSLGSPTQGRVSSGPCLSVPLLP